MMPEIMRPIGGRILLPLQLNYRDKGNVTVYVEAEEGVYGENLYKVVYGQFGYKLAPLNSSANKYYIGVVLRPNSRNGILEVFIGGTHEVIIRDDLNPGYMSICEGKVKIRSPKIDYLLNGEFGYMLEESGKDKYLVRLYPEMVVENDPIKIDSKRKKVVKDNSNSGK